MRRKRHALAIASLVVAAIETEPSRKPQRLRRSQLRWAAGQPEEELARELGVLALVGAARDAHLSELSADDGLAALCVPWQDVVVEAVALLDRPRPRQCASCGARLSPRRPVCGRCRSPAPRQ
jgi:hypothetical protein